jgi:hypothetical protein
MKNIIDKRDLDSLAKDMDPYVTRKKLCKLLGGMLSPGTLANWDSKKVGPGVKFKIGKSVAYRREEVIFWLSERLSIVK